jgi:hypothetical protein
MAFLLPSLPWHLLVPIHLQMFIVPVQSAEKATSLGLPNSHARILKCANLILVDRPSLTLTLDIPLCVGCRQSCDTSGILRQ